MELIFWLLAALVLPLAIAELVAWAPRVSSLLVDKAVSRLPEQLQERFSEEWHAHITEVPGPLSRIWCALQLNLASIGISSSHRRAAVSAASNNTNSASQRNWRIQIRMTSKGLAYLLLIRRTEKMLSNAIGSFKSRLILSFLTVLSLALGVVLASYIDKILSK